MLSGDGRYVAAGGDGGALSIFEHGRNDGPSGDLTSRKVLRAQTDAITGTAFESSSSWVASVSARDFVIWDQSDGTPELAILRGLVGAWTPDYKRRVRANQAGRAEVCYGGPVKCGRWINPTDFKRENAWYRVMVATSQPWTALG